MTGFQEYSGAGNRFLLADNRTGKAALSREEIARHCAASGVDGLILLEESRIADFRMVFYNPDGSGGMMCGNGGRCIVAFAADLGYTGFRFEAPDGIHEAEMLGMRGKERWIRLKMKSVPNYGEAGQETYFIDTGARHLVRFVDKAEETDVLGEGRRLRHAPAFAPLGVNVDFVEILPDAASVEDLPGCAGTDGKHLPDETPSGNLPDCAGTDVMHLPGETPSGNLPDYAGTDGMDLPDTASAGDLSGPVCSGIYPPSAVSIGDLPDCAGTDGMHLPGEAPSGNLPVCAGTDGKHLPGEASSGNLSGKREMPEPGPQGTAEFSGRKSAMTGIPPETERAQLKVRTYEKGVERETLACGTGIVAAALAYYARTGGRGAAAGRFLSTGFAEARRAPAAENSEAALPEDDISRKGIPFPSAAEPSGSFSSCGTLPPAAEPSDSHSSYGTLSPTAEPSDSHSSYGTLSPAAEASGTPSTKAPFPPAAEPSGRVRIVVQARRCNLTVDFLPSCTHDRYSASDIWLTGPVERPEGAVAEQPASLR